MCGISGVFDPKKTLKKNELDNLAFRMNRSLFHRGPNSQKSFIHENLALSSSRLSILDLDKRGEMPMSENSLTLIHNGEIYNYKEIKEELNLTNFKTDTDTEVILKSYNKEGPKCVERFNGMFSFVLWDDKKKQIFAARDRIGIKPFFYTWFENRFYFASEIKALLAVGIPAIPNYKILKDYLVHGVYDHSDQTFFKNIMQLPAGHSCYLTTNDFKIKKYWDIDCSLEQNSNLGYFDNKEFNNTKEEFISLFQDSLKLRLRSDVPVGINISGGIDSTAMINTINNIQEGQGSIRAFSYYYGEKKYDEINDVDEITKKFNWQVDFHKLNYADIPELALEVMRSQEQPFPGIITISKHNLIKSSQSYGAIVLLEGQGGDEIAAGYQYVFSSYLMDLITNGHPDLAESELDSFCLINKISKSEAIIFFMNGIASMSQTNRSADGSPFSKNNCLNKNFLKENNDEIYFEKPFKSHLLNMQYRDIRYTKLPRILRSCDRSSMAFSRELRVPLLDHRLVEFSFRIPGNFKIKNGVQRHFMREALKDSGHENLIDNPKKAVVDPQREWLGKELKEWVDGIFNSDTFRNRDIFNHSEILEEFNKYCKNDVNQNSFKLWQWISVELWFREFIDKDNLIMDN